MANTGKTNARWIGVYVDDATADAESRDISLDVTNVTIPINYNTADVTGYSDGVVNVTVGHPSVNVTMDGVFSNKALTGAHTVLTQIVGQDGGGAVAPYAPYTVLIKVGIRKVWEATMPSFTGQFICNEYTVNGDMTWHASFHPASTTLPGWV